MNNLNKNKSLQAENALATLMTICERLDAARIQHEVKKVRDDSLTIYAAVPGERWEIDIDARGDVSIERFQSIANESGLDQLDAMLRAQNAQEFDALN